MPGKNTRHVDGSRRRCTRCGHPQLEHHRDEACTVPKCECDSYEPAVERTEQRR